jgi:hypothetical protein
VRISEEVLEIVHGRVIDGGLQLPCSKSVIVSQARLCNELPERCFSVGLKIAGIRRSTASNH